MTDSKRIEIGHAEIGRDFNVRMGDEQEVDEFELSRTDAVHYEQLEPAVIADLWRRITGREPTIGDASSVKDRLKSGHLIWQAGRGGEFFATNLGVLLLYREPTATFPQARISAEAYLQRHDDPLLPTTPNDYIETSEPLPTAIESVVAFMRRNTKESFRIDGLDRVQITEYPEEAVREALVNAVAHRDYARRGEPVRVRVFKNDRITFRSPGTLMQGLTLAKLKSGRYDAKSRNPLLATYLSKYERLEQRGRGIQLMKDKMAGHGLDEPVFDLRDGWFEVALIGPGECLDKVKSSRAVWQIPPRTRKRLSARQEAIVAHALAEGRVTTSWCINELKVARDTAHRDLTTLVELNILSREGRGRASLYVLAATAPSEL